MNLLPLEMQAFVPARDLAVSSAFYTALGFHVSPLSDSVAHVRLGGTSFFLQAHYVPDHANNFMMHLRVASADDWHAHVRASGVAETFGVRVEVPSDKPWGMRDFALLDPAGVAWRIGQDTGVAEPSVQGGAHGADGNLHDGAFPPAEGERFDTLLARRNLVIERIVSSANTTPTPFVQTQDEWVMLAQGSATLEVDGVARRLRAGDHVFIAAHVPHTVTQVSDGAIWLAVHLHPDGTPAG